MRTLFILCCLLSSMLHADADYKILFGAEYGQAQAEWKNYSGDSKGMMGVRVGAESDETRIFLSYHYQKVDDFNFLNTDYTSHLVNMNFEAKTKKHYGFMRAFVGGHLGAIYSDWGLGYYSPLEDEDDLNFLYGAQAGLILDIIENLDMEVGYRYSLSDADVSTINPASIQGIYAAVNFKF